MPVSPSIYLTTCVREASAGRMFLKFGIADLHKICQQKPNLVEIRKKIGHFT